MIHVNDSLNRRSRTCHLKIVNVNHRQQIKLSVVKDALPDLRKNSSPAYSLHNASPKFRRKRDDRRVQA